MNPQVSPQGYVIAQLAVLFVSMVLCYQTISGGVISLFTLRGDSDSITAIAAIAVFIGCVMMAIFPGNLATLTVHIYPTVAVLGLLFNTIGKLLVVKRIQSF